MICSDKIEQKIIYFSFSVRELAIGVLIFRRLGILIIKEGRLHNSSYCFLLPTAYKYAICFVKSEFFGCKMFTFFESRQETIEDTEKHLDSQLWHACAGSMFHMPPLNSPVFYFPQGHLEHASGNVDLRNYPRFPPYVPCTLSGIKFMADPDTDEVFAKITLNPSTLNSTDPDGDGGISVNSSENQSNPVSIKMLTQSDANNGGGFSVPRYCAETVFPPLDFSSDPPSQNIHVRDVHGGIWTFRHIYRGTPRRHLLTTGWSSFVNHKKLVAGDSVIFSRSGNGNLRVGIRRARRNGGNSIGRGRLEVEDVMGAASLAAKGRSFEAVYYPRAGAPEFCVRASLVRAAMRIRWSPGMRFKMAFETEDLTRNSWFVGSVLSVRVVDPVWWPDSPWRLLQVQWDEPDMLQDMKHVSPWLVELVPTIDLSPFSPPLKRLKLAHHPDIKGHLPLPAFSKNPFLDPNNPFGCLSDNNNAPAGMQGARHAQYGSSLPNLDLGKVQSSLFNESISRIQESRKRDDDWREAKFMLFGQPILTEEQITKSCSSETVGNSSDGSGSGSGLNRDDGPERSSHERLGTGPGLGTGRCEVFVGSEYVGRSLDLCSIGSYDELYEKLAVMFGIEVSNILDRVVYRDEGGADMQLGDEAFSNFVKTARRLTVLADFDCDNVGV